MPLPETEKILWDMLRAGERIRRFAAGKTFDDYENDELLRSGIERQFEIIGEAMARLIHRDPATAGKISEHRKLAGFRNVLIHGYDAVDNTISWSIVERKLPILLEELRFLLPNTPSP